MSNSNKNIVLTLSGGGYRATLFGIGSLIRLNEFGLLSRINRITSVSGGSIISAYLAMKWKELAFNSKNEVATNFFEEIVEPLQVFCSKPLDVTAVLKGIVSLRETIGNEVAGYYAKRLFGQKTLQDIPTLQEGPEFLFYATSLQSGASVRFTREFIRDYKVGEFPEPDISLAQVVGASSAFPPFFAPVVFHTDPVKWRKTKGAYLFDNISYRRRLVLADGGVYDNMGLEAAWNDGYKSVFVCDAGASFNVTTCPKKNWFGLSLRVNSIITEQTRALRKRELISNYIKKEYNGAYWGVATEIDNYQLDDSIVNDNKITASLRNIRTRLNTFSKEEQGHLINWGYALTDTALRKYYFKEELKPGIWPLPEYALNKL